MEVKWVMIGIAVMVSAMFMGIGISEYQKSQCKTSLAWAGRSADDIIKICGK